MYLLLLIFFFFLFNDTATTEIYTLSLHDALPISGEHERGVVDRGLDLVNGLAHVARQRSEEHTSELQSHVNLACRILLEKKKQTTYAQTTRAAPSKSPAATASSSRM